MHIGGGGRLGLGRLRGLSLRDGRIRPQEKEYGTRQDRSHRTPPVANQGHALWTAPSQPRPERNVRAEDSRFPIPDVAINDYRFQIADCRFS
jgi:hypothetical protein